MTRFACSEMAGFNTETSSVVDRSHSNWKPKLECPVQRASSLPNGVETAPYSLFSSMQP